MNSADLLNIFLIIALVVAVTCIVYITFYLVSALKSITNLTDDTDEVVEGLKSKVQMKALLAIPAILLSLAGKLIKKRRGWGYGR